MFKFEEDIDFEKEISFLKIKEGKVFLMSIFSFGIYGIIWFYYQWKELVKNKETKCPALIATFFSVFYISFLVDKIYNIEKSSIHLLYRLAPLLIIASFLIKCENITILFLLYIFKIITISTTVFFLQKKINDNSKTIEYTSHNKIRNWVIVLLIFFVLNLIGKVIAYKSVYEISHFEAISINLSEYGTYYLFSTKVNNFFYKGFLLAFVYINVYNKPIESSITHMCITFVRVARAMKKITDIKNSTT